MNDHHTSKNFDLELESLRTRVLQMGGMAEEQVRKSIEGLYNGDQALLDSVAKKTEAVRQLLRKIAADYAPAVFANSLGAEDMVLTDLILRDALDIEIFSLDTGRLPVLRGIELTADDLLRRSIIQALMCHFELSIESIEIAHLIDFKQYFSAELADLREMEKGGLLTIDEQWISVKPAGRMLVRAIAMSFDKYLRADRERTRYSKVI